MSKLLSGKQICFTGTLEVRRADATKQAEAAGAKVVAVPLEPPHWSLPLDRLEAAFSDRTKLVLVNTPMNPIGKVFTRDELAAIAALMERHDAYAVCDEVYEHLVFSGHIHIPLMTLPGMRERCLRIGSAGKTFSLTGWKIALLHTITLVVLKRSALQLIQNTILRPRVRRIVLTVPVASYFFGHQTMVGLTPRFQATLLYY